MTYQKNLLLIALMFSCLTTFGQGIKFGARAGLGTGTINSNALQDYFNLEMANDADIKKYDLNAKLGPVFSIGGFVEYPLNENFSLIGEIGFQQQSSNLQIDLMEDDAHNTLSFRDRVESNNQIKISSINLPLLARYYLNANSGPYITGGFTIDLVLNSSIKAEEDIVEQEFDLSGNVIQSTSESRLNEADFDGFGSPRLSFTLGAGKVLEAGSSGITVDLRYNLGLTKSEMFTSNLVFEDLTEESDVFSVLKQADIAIDKGITLNDFKTGTLLLTVGYRF